MRRLLKLSMIFILLCQFEGVLAQYMSSRDSSYIDLPGPLKRAYQTRTMVINKDTVQYRRRWFIPGQYKLQFAGEIGFMSVGFGYEITPRYQPALFIGYVGENFGGSKKSVVTVSLKNSFYLTKAPIMDFFNPYLGISINWGNTHNTFKALPDYYPEKYYFQNKIHFAPFVGGELKFDIDRPYFNGWGIYAELLTFDAYLLEAIRTKYVKPHMALSMAIGITFYLK